MPGGASATEGDVSFARYVAENLAALDYRIAEEPLTVIYELRLVDAATGMQVLGAVLNLLAAAGVNLGWRIVPQRRLSST
mgnify:CR=1 FL=1